MRSQFPSARCGWAFFFFFFFFNVYLNSDSSTVQKYNYKEYRIEGPENGTLARRIFGGGGNKLVKETGFSKTGGKGRAPLGKGYPPPCFMLSI